MCGIVGYTGPQKVIPILLEGLKRLEYRGYDSAGVAVIDENDTHVFRSEGKLGKLTEKLSHSKIHGLSGIGHTRWATHGRPTVINAHPHQVGRVLLVHNGIIENYDELKKLLPRKGAELKSETDTEVACQLIDLFLKKGDSFKEAFHRTLDLIHGTYAFVAIDQQEPTTLYVAKKSSPLVVGVGQDEHFVASDIPALLPYTKNVIFLEDDETAIITPSTLQFFNRQRKKLIKLPKEIGWTLEMAEKGGYEHYMLKEIMEQPQAVLQALLGRLDKEKNQIVLSDLDKIFKGKKFPFFNRFHMVACGTSWHAALAGKYFMESISKIPVSVDTASEFRYREPFIDNKTLLLVISQSGETADTLACVKEARKRKAKIISICNVVDSSIPRLSHATLYTQAGPEIGVASTKAFTTQLVVLLLLALRFGTLNKRLKPLYIRKAISQLEVLPELMNRVLKQKDKILQIAEKLKDSRDVYYLARGVHYPIALEGALKLKEISYIHAEGYAAGEMKHGPIALIENGTPVVALAPNDRVCLKMISNIQEVRARGAEAVVVATEGDPQFKGRFPDLITVPVTLWYLTPILVSLPLQLLAYYISKLRGTDVDQPRNLAKSVTVE